MSSKLCMLVILLIIFKIQIGCMAALTVCNDDYSVNAGRKGLALTGIAVRVYYPSLHEVS